MTLVVASGTEAAQVGEAEGEVWGGADRADVVDAGLAGAGDAGAADGAAPVVALECGEAGSTPCRRVVERVCMFVFTGHERSRDLGRISWPRAWLRWRITLGRLWFVGFGLVGHGLRPLPRFYRV